MKVTVEMDLTPDEARRMMGLPDLTAMQARLVEEFERRMMAAMEKSAPEEVMKQWFTLGSQGFEQFQRFMWDGARNAAGTRKETPKSK
jgi:hypothetical protein